MVTAAMGLGVEQPKVRIPQQCLGIRTVIRVDADTDADSDVQTLIADPVRLAHCGEYLLSGEGRSMCGLPLAIDPHARRRHEVTVRIEHVPTASQA
jgi:hypothetical protein